MKQLILCRHAKSSWNDISVHDIDRLLNKRGKQDALVMGKRLARKGVKPDAIISSSAVRARKTAARLARELNYSPKKIKVADLLYGATVEEMFNFVSRLDDSWKLVIIVGHNPELTIFTHIVADFNVINIPTCGVVYLEFEADCWKEVTRKSGKIIFFDYPKKVAMGERL